jgi:hypothetical protein
MLKNRLFYLFLALSLIGLVGFTSNPSRIMSKIIFGPDPSLQKVVPAVQQVTAPLGEYCPFTAQELQSLHTVTVGSDHEPMLETSDGPIGFDGGTFALSQCRLK